MAGTVDVGTGLTMTFATSSYSAEITGVTIDGRSVPVIDTTHMGTTNSRTFRFGDLKTEGTVGVEIHYDPDSPPPLGTEETVTVTYPVPSGLTNGATDSGTGGIFESSASIPLEDKMVGSYTVNWNDEVTNADAS